MDILSQNMGTSLALAGAARYTSTSPKLLKSLTQDFAAYVEQLVAICQHAPWHISGGERKAWPISLLQLECWYTRSSSAPRATDFIIRKVKPLEIRMVEVPYPVSIVGRALLSVAPASLQTRYWRDKKQECVQGGCAYHSLHMPKVMESTNCTAACRANLVQCSQAPLWCQ